MSSQRPIIGFTAELERQAWDDEGREEDRQKALSSASEGDGLALGGLEGLSSAGVSATANLQGVTSGEDLGVAQGDAGIEGVGDQGYLP